MKRHLILAMLTSLGIAAAAPVAANPNCGQRDAVIEKLTNQYKEQLTVGGLQQRQSLQSVMEIWSSEETGTFTVLITNAQGVSCIVAAGTDFFEADRVPVVKGTAS